MEFITIYESGLQTQTNIAGWDYDIRNSPGNDSTATVVEKSSIDLKSSVIVRNYGHSQVGVQINYIPYFIKYSLNGWISTESDGRADSYVFMLPEP